MGLGANELTRSNVGDTKRITASSTQERATKCEMKAATDF